MDDRIASRQWRTVAIDSSGWWLAGSGCGVWGGENEIKRKKKNKGKKMKMKEDRECVIVGVFGKW